MMGPRAQYRRWISGGVLVAALPVLGSCDYIRSFEAVCEKRLPPAHVEVVADTIQYQTDFTRSIEQLSAKGAAASGKLVLGLVETKLAGSAEFTAKGIVKPLSGRYCTRPSLKVTLSFKPTTVYVARQYPQGSCEFDITMGHEMKHIAVYQRYLDDLAVKVQSEMKEKLGTAISYYDNVELGEKDLQARTAAVLLPYLDRGAVESARRQALVDSPEEYARLDVFQSKCSPR